MEGRWRLGREGQKQGGWLGGTSLPTPLTILAQATRPHGPSYDSVQHLAAGDQYPRNSPQPITNGAEDEVCWLPRLWVEQSQSVPCNTAQRNCAPVPAEATCSMMYPCGLPFLLYHCFLGPLPERNHLPSNPSLSCASGRTSGRQDPGESGDGWEGHPRW